MKNLELLELRVPPVALVIIAASVMWLFSQYTNGFPLPTLIQLFLFVLFLASGISCSVAGVLSFKKAQTTVNPMAPESSSSLVSTGIYQRTRNPMYVGMALSLIGWGFFLANLYSLGIVAGFVIYMTRFQIIPEERALAKTFSADFNAYRKQVSRWL